MLYSEFVAGTGCRENDHNYKVYECLEKVYMISDISKEDVYRFAKKVVDNSKTPKEIELENQIKSEIQDFTELIEYNNGMIDFYKTLESVAESEDDAKRYRGQIKICRSENKQYRQRINGLKWVLK